MLMSAKMPLAAKQQLIAEAPASAPIALQPAKRVPSPGQHWHRTYKLGGAFAALISRRLPGLFWPSASYRNFS